MDLLSEEQHLEELIDSDSTYIETNGKVMKKDTSPALPGVFMSFCERCRSLFEKGGVQKN